MLLIEKINPLAFFVAFCVGLFAVYITTPTPEVVIKYPTPETADSLVYTDAADNCYKYKATETTCTADAKPIPTKIKRKFLETFNSNLRV
jgi:hypothetical protein